MDWEEKYQIGDCPWDKGEASPGLQEWLNEHKFSGRVIVPGCGLGHDARYIADACPDCEVLAIDLSPTAIMKARQLPNPKNVTFQEGNLFELPEELIHSSDWVFEHTCLCALPVEKRSEYIGSVRNLLKPKGKYLAVFFINPDMDEGSEGPPFGISKKEIRNLFEEHFSIDSTWNPKSFYQTRIDREMMGILTKK